MKLDENLPAPKTDEANLRIANCIRTFTDVLDLSGLHLREIPESIREIIWLRVLYCGRRKSKQDILDPELAPRNYLRYLPTDALLSLRHLEVLDLEGNQLTELPSELGRLSQLTLLVRDNPLPTRLLELAENSELLNYLRGLDTASSKSYESKLLLTGHGKAGKTCLIKALRGEDAKEITADDRTYGVELGTLTLPHPTVNGTQITFNSWDFGGQDVYRVTHQLFFSDEAIYLPVWNPHDGDNVARVSDWLRRIYVRVGDSQSKRVGAKVILVATHCGQTSKYSNRIELSAIPDELAALVVGQASVDSHEMIGISDLKRLIAHHAATLPHMGEVVPKHWIMKRDAILALRGEGLKTISYAEFEKHCGSQPYRVPSDQAFILAKQFLHRSGRAAFYGRRIPGEEGSFQDRLEGQRLILDAEWLTKAVVRVVDDLKTREAGGVLDHGRLYYLWREHGRTDWEVYEEGDFAFLIALLHTLNVSYVLKGQSDRSLVAELVPDAPPANWPWSSPGNIQERTFICEIKGQAYGLMARLNVETFGDHVRVPGSSGRGYFWQRGIFLRETASGNEALLELIEKGTDTLRVLVRGPHPDALFWRLHGTVRETVKFWPGLAERIAFKVPCLTNKGSANACMGDFKIDALFKLKNKHPEGSISCQDCGRAHKYNALLGGLSGHNLDVDAEQAFERFTNRVEKTIEAAAKDVISVVRSVDDRLALSLPALLAEVEGGRIEAQALYRAFISRTDALCPRLFSIEEVPGGLVTRIKSLVVGRTYRVRLFCEYSGETSVDRNIVVSQDWLRKLAPYFGYAAVALAGIAPQAGKLSLGMLSASYSMMAFSRQFRDDPGATVLGRLPTDGRAGYADGADLRVLHAFLKTYHIGPDYGGMERLEMGKIWHWVSKSVYETYRPATPIVQRHVQSAVDRVSQAQLEKRRLQS